MLQLKAIKFTTFLCHIFIPNATNAHSYSATPQLLLSLRHDSRLISKHHLRFPLQQRLGLPTFKEKGSLKWLLFAACIIGNGVVNFLDSCCAAVL